MTICRSILIEDTFRALSVLTKGAAGILGITRPSILNLPQTHPSSNIIHSIDSICCCYVAKAGISPSTPGITPSLIPVAITPEQFMNPRHWLLPELNITFQDLPDRNRSGSFASEEGTKCPRVKRGVGVGIPGGFFTHGTIIRVEDNPCSLHYIPVIDPDAPFPMPLLSLHPQSHRSCLTRSFTFLRHLDLIMLRVNHGGL